MSESEPAIADDREEKRFQVETPAGLAVLDYLRTPERLILTHTEVPEAVRKRGIGTRLVEAAFRAAREQGLSVVPKCPFVRAYVERHPEVRDVVEERR